MSGARRSIATSNDRAFAGRSVAVIGGGVAGFAVAILLKQRGAQVHLFEQAPALLPFGAGLQISPNGGAVLRELGVNVDGLDSGAVVLCDYAQGSKVARLDLKSAGFRLVHRADLISALAQKAAGQGVDIQFGTAAKAEDINADLVVAADGVKSAARQALGPGADPFFTGQTAWRAVIDDPGGPPEAKVYMGPHRHLVTYPLTQGRRNIVAVREQTDWVEEDWDLADDPANLRAAFADFAPELRGWLEQVDQVKLWGLFRHPVAERWHNGKTVTIGDAAHPTLPFLAQGANLALEDAMVLARCLDTYPKAEALDRFEKTRIPRVTRAISAANANASNYHLPHGPKRLMAHTGLRAIDKVAPGLLLKRFDWLYGYDPVRAPIS